MTITLAFRLWQGRYRWLDAEGIEFQGDVDALLDALAAAKCRTIEPIPDDPEPGWWSECEPIPQPPPRPEMWVYWNDRGWLDVASEPPSAPWHHVERIYTDDDGVRRVEVIR